MKPYIIMFNGYTGCGKTTSAVKLFSKFRSEGIDCKLFKSCEIRHALFSHYNQSPEYFDQNNPEGRIERDRAVKKMCKSAKDELKKGKTAILDSTFTQRYKRKDVYDIVEELKIDLYVVQCICLNESEIQSRIKDRYEFTDLPEKEAKAMEVYYYIKNQAESIDEDRLNNGKRPKIIRHDTEHNKVEFLNFETEQEEGIGEKIKQCLV